MARSWCSDSCARYAPVAIWQHSVRGAINCLRGDGLMHDDAFGLTMTIVWGHQAPGMSPGNLIRSQKVSTPQSGGSRISEPLEKSLLCRIDMTGFFFRLIWQYSKKLPKCINSTVVNCTVYSYSSREQNRLREIENVPYCANLRIPHFYFLATPPRSGLIPDSEYKTAPSRVLLS